MYYSNYYRVYLLIITMDDETIKAMILKGKIIDSATAKQLREINNIILQGLRCDKQACDINVLNTKIYEYQQTIKENEELRQAIENSLLDQINDENFEACIISKFKQLDKNLQVIINEKFNQLKKEDFQLIINNLLDQLNDKNKDFQAIIISLLGKLEDDKDIQKSIIDQENQMNNELFVTIIISLLKSI